MASKRDLRLDTIRGVMLLIMAINHLPWAKTPITGEPFGFVSAAEGFVFLSGLVCAMAYGKTFLQKSFEEARHKIVKRVQKIFTYHYGSLLLLMVMAFLLPLRSWIPLFSPLDSEPLTAAVLGAFLLYQPAFLDILPLYCLLLLATPWLLWQFVKGHGFLILIASFALWVLAQMGVYQHTIAFLASFLPVRMGIFDYLAWQFLFVLGAYLGFMSLQNVPVISRIGPLWYCCLGLALCFLVLRHLAAPGSSIHMPFFSDFLSLAEKNMLRPLRLLNFLVLAYLIAVAAKTWPKAFIAEPLARMGQKSLELFTIHVFWIYGVFAWKEAFQNSVSVQLVTAIALIGTLLALATLLQSRMSLPSPNRQTAVPKRLS
jgi:hypothetical protein